MTDQTESVHAELLADLDFYDEDNWRNVMRQYPGAQDAIRKAAAAIRALEAKTAAAEAAVQEVGTLLDWMTNDRDRLSEALAVEQRIAKSWQETAEKFRAERDHWARAAESYQHEALIHERGVSLAQEERDRLAGEVERLEAEASAQRNRVADLRAANLGFLVDNTRLTSELDKAREELAQRREHMRRGMPLGVATPARWDNDDARSASEGGEA